MLNLVFRKIIQGVLVAFVVSAVTFSLLSAAGGDALTNLRDNPQVSPETVERLRIVYGLDRPISSRYFSWISASISGDLGESLYFKTPVAGLVFSRLLNTFALGATALTGAFLFAAFLVFLSARFPGGGLDDILDIVAVVSASLPRIVVALFVLAIVVRSTGSAFEVGAGSWMMFFISSIVMAIPLFAVLLAQMHSGFKGAMKEPFVQFARAKGLSENAIIFRHASRAALNPLLSVLGLSFGTIVSGSVIVETILGWPGIGSLTVAAVRGRDISLMMGIVVVSSIFVWFGNGIAELLQVLNDRRMLAVESARLN